MVVVLSSDPMLWTADQVIHWAVWVMKEFNIDEMEIGSIHIPGRDLCTFSQEEFLQKVPNGEILWSHLELLRKCKCLCPVYTMITADCVFLEVNRNKVASHMNWAESNWSSDMNLFVCHFFLLISDVLASQDQSGGDATVTIDQRKCSSAQSAKNVLKRKVLLLTP